MDNGTEVKKSFWKDAARAGGIIGLLLFILTLVEVLVTASWIRTLISLVYFLTLGYGIYYFTRQRSLKYPAAEGFSFAQGMGYVLAMMLFTGFIFGVGNYLLSNFIAPAYYDQAYETLLESNLFFDPDSSTADDFEAMFKALRRNPLFNVFSGIFGMLFYGGVIGLLASAFVKRKPDIFADENRDNDTVNE